MQAYDEQEDTLRMDIYPDAIVLTRGKLQPGERTHWMMLACVLLAACILPLASLVGQFYIMTHPFTASVLVQVQNVQDIARVYRLPSVTTKHSQVVATTGRKHIAATQAHGLITFYNGLSSPQTIQAGELLTGADGEEVVTDADITIPAGTLTTNGAASVGAHALDFGLAGNIKAGDIEGPCCKAWVKVINSQFTGGRNAKDYQLVTKVDIATATANLLSQVQASNGVHLSPFMTLLTPVPCSTATSSNHKAGDPAQQVQVTVMQTCYPSAYRPGDISQRLISLVVGKTKQQALERLYALSGIRNAKISWLDDMQLPKDARYVHLVILIG